MKSLIRELFNFFKNLFASEPKGENKKEKIKPIEQSPNLKAKYYPESEGLPNPPLDLENSVAVCFSGGGSRACTAAMGQMRALHHLNLLDRKKIKCISSVSGGTWASILYAYRSPDIDIETFLGGVVEDPGKLTWFSHHGENKAEILNYLDFNNLGMVPTRLGIFELLKTMIELYEKYKYPASDLWIRTVGKLVLEPFGLSKTDDEGNPEKYMGYTEKWIEENPVRRNPGKLSVSDFSPMPDDEHRPYLITNTALFADPVTLVPYQISPVYQGIFNTLNIGGNTLGGGYLDTYAFGSGDPGKLTNDQVAISQMHTRTCLADAAGLSSAFFAEILEGLVLKGEGDITKLEEYKALHFLSKEFKALSKEITDIGDLIPKFSYWSTGALQNKNAKTKTYQFADGGNLENSGITPLLQRSCTSIISFINSMTPLEESDEGLIVDGTLPPLFGYCPKSKGKPYRKFSEMTKEEIEELPEGYKLAIGVQVFSSDDFFPLLDKLASASKGQSDKLGADPALCIQHLVTIQNEMLDIKAGLSVKVLWVYNNPVEKWRSQLSREVRWLMDLEVIDYDDFPNYNTISKIHLNHRQVNLLAHLSCWNILQNKELFFSMWEKT